MAPPDESRKRRPPTFHHLPEFKAKKLKHDWVQKAKVKSKWKAQKRRELGPSIYHEQNQEHNSVEDNPTSEHGREDGPPSQITVLNPSATHYTARPAHFQGKRQSQKPRRVNKRVEEAQSEHQVRPNRSTFTKQAPTMKARMNHLLDKIKSMQD